MAGWWRRANSEARSRARDQARWLVRDHGDGAEEALEEKLRRKNASSSMRKIYRLTRRELRALRRAQKRGSRAPRLAALLRRVRAMLGGRGRPPLRR